MDRTFFEGFPGVIFVCAGSALISLGQTRCMSLKDILLISYMKKFPSSF